MVKNDQPGGVRVGKFEILATYTYAKALLDGLPEGEAKERGMVAAVMGAKAKGGHGGGTHDDHKADKDAAEKKKKTTITAESFDHQVADKMGGFFDVEYMGSIKIIAVAKRSYYEAGKLSMLPAKTGSSLED